MTSVYHERARALRALLESIQRDDEVVVKAKPKNKCTRERKSGRHSVYRGVSKNGKKWQVMIMGKSARPCLISYLSLGMKCKEYCGAIMSELHAAMMYDKLAIMSHGLAAKTNFNYTKRDTLQIIDEFSTRYC